MTTQELQRETTFITQLSTLDRQQTEAEEIKQALLAAMQDVGNPKDVIEVDYLSADDNVPATGKINLSDVCGGVKRIDPYLKMRMAR